MNPSILDFASSASKDGGTNGGNTINNGAFTYNVSVPPINNGDSDKKNPSNYTSFLIIGGLAVLGFLILRKA